MKDETSKWYKVEDLLGKLGLGEVWINPHQWDKKSLKSFVTQELCNISLQ